MTELKKGNLVFLKTHLVDLFYIVKEVKADRVVARKLDGPPNQWEYLPLDKVVKLADEQEKLLPTEFNQAIEKQRMVVFAPPKQGGKKKRSIDKMLKGLPDAAIEEILETLSKAGVTAEENGEEKEDKDEVETDAFPKD